MDVLDVILPDENAVLGIASATLSSVFARYSGLPHSDGMLRKIAKIAQGLSDSGINPIADGCKKCDFLADSNLHALKATKFIEFRLIFTQSRLLSLLCIPSAEALARYSTDNPWCVGMSDILFALDLTKIGASA